MWTFQIQGGQPHILQTTDNRVYEHNGRLSVWHVVCDEMTRNNFVFALESGGCTVSVHSDYPSYSQTQLREKRFNIQAKEHVFLTPKCPRCFFFTPEEKEPCGLLAWSKDYLQKSLQKHEKARIDIVDCPYGE